MNIDIYTEAIELHKKNGGKLETHSKLRLNSKEVLSLAYSPGVAGVSSAIAKDSLLAKEYTLKKNTVAVVSDGSSVLGLGNIGALAAIPVMEGKAAIFKEFAGVDAFPICLDTQDTEEIIKTVKQLAPVFGGINLEDISAPRCFEIEERLRKELDIPVMHDDQWGAATVTLAGIINSLKLKNLDKTKAKVVINGLGAAGVATGRLLIEYGITDIIFCDSKGIVHSKRTDLNKEKSELLSKSTADIIEGSLADAVAGKDIFIGLSKPGVLTQKMVKTMTDMPVVFALANPTPEILPEEAREAGVYIMGTGRSDYPNQVNNSLVFPGLFKGMLKRGGQFDNSIFVGVAKALAEHIQNPTPEYILPNMFDREVVDIVYNYVLGH
jgi:malate dehydrogenase (oxaloacetate-decarboxylating)